MSKNVVTGGGGVRLSPSPPVPPPPPSPVAPPISRSPFYPSPFVPKKKVPQRYSPSPIPSPRPPPSAPPPPQPTPLPPHTPPHSSLPRLDEYDDFYKDSQPSSLVEERPVSSVHADCANYQRKLVEYHIKKEKEKQRKEKKRRKKLREQKKRKEWGWGGEGVQDILNGDNDDIFSSSKSKDNKKIQKDLSVYTRKPSSMRDILHNEELHIYENHDNENSSNKGDEDFLWDEKNINNDPNKSYDNESLLSDRSTLFSFRLKNEFPSSSSSSSSSDRSASSSYKKRKIKKEKKKFQRGSFLVSSPAYSQNYNAKFKNFYTFNSPAYKQKIINKQKNYYENFGLAQYTHELNKEKERCAKNDNSIVEQEKDILEKICLLWKVFEIADFDKNGHVRTRDFRWVLHRNERVHSIFGLKKKKKNFFPPIQNYEHDEEGRKKGEEISEEKKTGKTKSEHFFYWLTDLVRNKDDPVEFDPKSKVKVDRMEVFIKKIESKIINNDRCIGDLTMTFEVFCSNFGDFVGEGEGKIYMPFDYTKEILASKDTPYGLSLSQMMARDAYLGINLTQSSILCPDYVQLGRINLIEKMGVSLKQNLHEEKKTKDKIQNFYEKYYGDLDPLHKKMAKNFELRRKLAEHEILTRNIWKRSEEEFNASPSKSHKHVKNIMQKHIYDETPDAILYRKIPRVESIEEKEKKKARELREGEEEEGGEVSSVGSITTKSLDIHSFFTDTDATQVGLSFDYENYQERLIELFETSSAASSKEETFSTPPSSVSSGPPSSRYYPLSTIFDEAKKREKKKKKLQEKEKKRKEEERRKKEEKEGEKDKEKEEEKIEEKEKEEKRKKKWQELERGKSVPSSKYSGLSFPPSLPRPPSFPSLTPSRLSSSIKSKASVVSSRKYSSLFSFPSPRPPSVSLPAPFASPRDVSVSKISREKRIEEEEKEKEKEIARKEKEREEEEEKLRKEKEKEELIRQEKEREIRELVRREIEKEKEKLREEERERIREEEKERLRKEKAKEEEQLQEKEKLRKEKPKEEEQLYKLKSSLLLQQKVDVSLIHEKRPSLKLKESPPLLPAPPSVPISLERISLPGRAEEVSFPSPPAVPAPSAPPPLPPLPQPARPIRPRLPTPPPAVLPSPPLPSAVPASPSGSAPPPPPPPPKTSPPLAGLVETKSPKPGTKKGTAGLLWKSTDSVEWLLESESGQEGYSYPTFSNVQLLPSDASLLSSSLLLTASPRTKTSAVISAEKIKEKEMDKFKKLDVVIDEEKKKKILKAAKGRAAIQQQVKLINLKKGEKTQPALLMKKFLEEKVKKKEAQGKEEKETFKRFSIAAKGDSERNIFAEQLREKMHLKKKHLEEQIVPKVEKVLKIDKFAKIDQTRKERQDIARIEKREEKEKDDKKIEEEMQERYAKFKEKFKIFEKPATGKETEEGKKKQVIIKDDVLQKVLKKKFPAKLPPPPKLKLKA